MMLSLAWWSTKNLQAERQEYLLKVSLGYIRPFLKNKTKHSNKNKDKQYFFHKGSISWEQLRVRRQNMWESVSLRMLTKKCHLTVVLQAATLPSLALERGGKVVCPTDLLREMWADSSTLIVSHHRSIKHKHQLEARRKQG